VTGKRFLNAVANSETDLIAILLDILEEAGAAYCVVGGLAVSAYVEPVVSLDLDLVVALSRLEEVCAAAEARGLKAQRFEHSVNLASARSDLRIQLQTDERYQPFLGRAMEREVLGYRLRVADVADVLEGKVWAFLDETRRKSKRQKDLADILRLVEACPALLRGLPQAVREQL